MRLLPPWDRSGRARCYLLRGSVVWLPSANYQNRAAAARRWFRRALDTDPRSAQAHLWAAADRASPDSHRHARLALALDRGDLNRATRTDLYAMLGDWPKVIETGCDAISREHWLIATSGSEVQRACTQLGHPEQAEALSALQKQYQDFAVRLSETLDSVTTMAKPTSTKG